MVKVHSQKDTPCPQRPVLHMSELHKEKEGSGAVIPARINGQAGVGTWGSQPKGLGIQGREERLGQMGIRGPAVGWGGWEELWEGGGWGLKPDSRARVSRRGSEMGRWVWETERGTGP